MTKILNYEMNMCEEFNKFLDDREEELKQDIFIYGGVEFNLNNKDDLDRWNRIEEKHYIEKEMCWRLDVQLLSLKDDGRQAEVNRLIEDNDVALSTNEMMMKYGKI